MEKQYLTSQEVFDKVYNGLVEQGTFSVDMEKEECRYRSPNGYKCAAGMLIADEYYTPDIEGLGAQHGIVKGILELSGVSPHDIGLVCDLQEVHDAFGMTLCSLKSDTSKAPTPRSVRFKKDMEQIKKDWDL